jgi:hypothetical protein
VLVVKRTPGMARGWGVVENLKARGEIGRGFDQSWCDSVCRTAKTCVGG